MTWLSDDLTTSATYLPEVDAVRVSQVQREGGSHHVFVGRDDLEAVAALFPQPAPFPKRETRP